MNGFVTLDSENFPNDTLKSPTIENYTITNCFSLTMFIVFFSTGIISEIVMLIIFFSLNIPQLFKFSFLFGIIYIFISFCIASVFPLKYSITINTENETITIYSKKAIICLNKKLQFNFKYINKIYTKLNSSVKSNGHFGFDIVFELKNGEKERVIKG